MATAEQIKEVRLNINEPSDALFDDVTVSGWIDSTVSLEEASAEGWLKKASVYADLANVSEAGASHAYGELYKNALVMRGIWADKAEALTVSVTSGRTRVRKIER